MIVQPDFLDHWKTQMLQESLDDTSAPLYVIRLWSHCQNRKTHRFQRVNDSMLKAICKAPFDGTVFEKAMIDAGFVEIEDGEIVAHDWEEVNAYLITSWNNGRKGGRPRNKNPRVLSGLTQSKPTANPRQTQPKPIREEKRREDSNSSNAVPVETECFISAKKRKLTGKRLEAFKRFWAAFNFPKDRASAIDAWLDIPELTNQLVEEICKKAKIEAAGRKALLADGRTPKYPQGWITARRWEDEIFEETQSKSTPASPPPYPTNWKPIMMTHLHDKEPHLVERYEGIDSLEDLPFTLRKAIFGR